ncbi:MAG: asparagine synthase (glutamine-hydrolyzing) [Bdellovibrio sp.]|nr:asparagine synthase (glutamine-hydrolyzing) [Bdellovibrio sp.]
MCGIAGLVNKNGIVVNAELLNKMANAMKHRGPDADGVFVYQNFGLAFRRLKIIDLSDLANQPMFNEDGKVGVVFNGEIYNFQELRCELQTVGHVFKSQSDTEVIVHGFEQWGESFFKKLNGMFAFSILDLRTQCPSLYLVRDRFGIKPLFYSLLDKNFAFASELKPLLQLNWISKDISSETLLYYLKFSHVPQPLSILKNIQQLKSGHYLKYQEHVLTEGVYFDSIQLSQKTENNTYCKQEDEVLSECEHILKQVVTRQIISDVPVGCFLSGGIDSSLLTMSYAELEETKGRPIKTFTISYEEKEFDEGRFASEIAKAFHTEHYELLVKPKDLFDLIPKISEYFDQPLADTTALPTLLLAKFAKEKVTVALSGDGGDELFWGYPHQRALLVLNELQKLPFGARKVLFGSLRSILKASLFGPFKNKFCQQMVKLFDILQFQDEGQFYQNFVGSLGPLQMPELASLLKEKADFSRPFFTDILEQLRPLDLEEKVTHLFLKTFLVDTVLAKTDRAGMAVGLEARVPFLDNEFVDFSFRLPFSYKLKLGESKYLLRRLLRKKLIEHGLSSRLSKRKKQGFSIPMRDWLRGELRYLLQDYLSFDRLKREGVFQENQVQRIVVEHLENRANHSHLLWSLLVFQMWKEHFSA